MTAYIEYYHKPIVLLRQHPEHKGFLTLSGEVGGEPMEHEPVLDYWQECGRDRTLGDVPVGHGYQVSFFDPSNTGHEAYFLRVEDEERRIISLSAPFFIQTYNDDNGFSRDYHVFLPAILKAPGMYKMIVYSGNNLVTVDHRTFWVKAVAEKRKRNE